MRAQRVKTGFHRIGIVLAAICAIFAALMMLRERASWGDALAVAITGVALYALADALGWIIAGFAGDE